MHVLMEDMKKPRVSFHSDSKDKVVVHNIRLPKQSTVRDLMNELKSKVKLSRPDAELRLLEVYDHKIYKIFPSNQKIENINDRYWRLRAEEIPEEEKNPGPNDRLIHVYHFKNDPAQNQMVRNFGEPFLLIIHEGETVADVKTRIRKKLRVPDREFAEWKFALVTLGRPEYLQEEDILSLHFQEKEDYEAWEQYLGLEDSDDTPKRSSAAKVLPTTGVSSSGSSPESRDEALSVSTPSERSPSRASPLPVSRYKKDIEACTKAFEDADATIKTMLTDYWEARQQRDAKRKELAAAEDEVSRLQAELARAQERASELQSQLAEAGLE